MLLPYLLAGLGGSVVPDYRAATYMVVGQLAARATFSADLAAGARLDSRVTGALQSVHFMRVHLRRPLLPAWDACLRLRGAPPMMPHLRSRRRPPGPP